MAEPTPMMARYLEVKAEHPGTLLLFRMGDFYELFYEDAELAASALGITLTSRDKGSPNPVPMAGFPHHALRTHLSKLIRRGHRVAVCEQMEDPATAKGMVRREVTQVVTPGTLTDDDLLEPSRSNFLAALHRPRSSQKKGGDVGLSWLDVSTGRFVAADLAPGDLADELARVAPAELLIAEGTARPRPRTGWGASSRSGRRSRSGGTRRSSGCGTTSAPRRCPGSTWTTPAPASPPPRPCWTTPRRRRRPPCRTSSPSNRTAATTACGSTRRPAAAWSSPAPSPPATAPARC